MEGSHLRSRAAILAFAAVIATALTAATGCSAGAKAPDFSTPRATLETFFDSAQRLDYATTYSCYYERYQEVVSEQDFVKRRQEAGVLTSYRIDSLDVNGNSADATVTLAFASAKTIGAKPKTVQTQEHLVKQAGLWKVQVW
jgi:coenzyme F420-reducing hydrogenase beta subunit